MWWLVGWVGCMLLGLVTKGTSADVYIAAAMIICWCHARED